MQALCLLKLLPTNFIIYWCNLSSSYYCGIAWWFYFVSLSFYINSNSTIRKSCPISTIYLFDYFTSIGSFMILMNYSLTNTIIIYFASQIVPALALRSYFGLVPVFCFAFGSCYYHLGKDILSSSLYYLPWNQPFPQETRIPFIREQSLESNIWAQGVKLAKISDNFKLMKITTNWNS